MLITGNQKSSWQGCSFKSSVNLIYTTKLRVFADTFCMIMWSSEAKGRIVFISKRQNWESGLFFPAVFFLILGIYTVFCYIQQIRERLYRKQSSVSPHKNSSASTLLMVIIRKQIKVV